jgi:hypothetical protein
MIVGVTNILSYIHFKVNHMSTDITDYHVIHSQTIFKMGAVAAILKIETRRFPKGTFPYPPPPQHAHPKLIRFDKPFSSKSTETNYWTDWQTDRRTDIARDDNTPRAHLGWGAKLQNDNYWWFTNCKMTTNWFKNCKMTTIGGSKIAKWQLSGVQN